jgi:hypothetical protein
MDTVQKHIYSNYHSPSSEPYRVYIKISTSHSEYHPPHPTETLYTNHSKQYEIKEVSIEHPHHTQLVKITDSTANPIHSHAPNIVYLNKQCYNRSETD